MAANWFIVFFGGAAAVDFFPPPMRLSKLIERPLSLHVEGEGCSKRRGTASYWDGTCQCAYKIKCNMCKHGAIAQPWLVLQTLLVESERVAV